MIPVNTVFCQRSPTLPTGKWGMFVSNSYSCIRLRKLREVVSQFVEKERVNEELAKIIGFEEMRFSPDDYVNDTVFDWAENTIGGAIGIPVTRSLVVSLCKRRSAGPDDAVTLLKNATRHLSTSCDRFRATLENINQGVFMFDKDSKLVVWNKKSVSLLDLPDDFLRVGISLEDLAHFNAARGEYGPGNASAYVRRIVEGAKKPVEHRFERIRPNGAVLEIFGKPLPYGGFVTTFTDITERKKAEQALKTAYDNLEVRIDERTRELRESQERFRQMLDSSSDWYWETDTEHRFSYISDRYFYLTGFRAEDVIGRARWELHNVRSISESSDCFVDFRRDLDGHRPFRNVDYAIRRESGDEMIVRTSGQPFFSDSGEFLGYRGTATDATASVAAQQELLRSEKLAALGGLVAGVAHEINTPVGIGLTAATYLEEKTRTLSAMLSDGSLKKSDLEAFMEIVGEISCSLTTNLRRAAMLVKSFKQVAVDQSSNASRCFNLANYIDEILTSLAPRMKRTGHSVHVDCPHDLEVSCNPGAISQILTNLIINSLVHGFEYKDCGKICVQVIEEGAALSLVYEDDGKGVPATNLRNIFQPFFTTKRGQGGSGLGLNIIYNLITQSLGGRIEFSSVEGEGVRFFIQIPDIVCHDRNKES